MKLDVPYKIVNNVPKELIEESLSLIKPEHWYLDDTRNKMGNLEKTQTIFVRYFDDYKFAQTDMWKEHLINHPLYDYYLPVVAKFLKILKQNYNFSNYMCFFAKLLPNSNIGFHADGGPFLEECNRIHIPLKTNKDVYYIIENQKSNWIVGNIYEFDNTRLHGVENNSDKERIHLMFNLY